MTRPVNRLTGPWTFCAGCCDGSELFKAEAAGLLDVDDDGEVPDAPLKWRVVFGGTELDYAAHDGGRYITFDVPTTSEGEFELKVYVWNSDQADSWEEVEQAEANGEHIDHADHIYEVTVVKLKTLQVRDRNHPANSETATDLTTVPELYVGETLLDKAKLDVIATIVPDTAAARQEVYWEVDGNDADPDDGDFGFSPDVSVDINESFIFGNNNFVVKAGCDSNQDDSLDSNEISHKVNVHFIEFDELKVSDKNNSSVSVTVDESNSSDELYVCQNPSGDTKITLDPDIDDDTEAFRSRVVWTIVEDSDTETELAATFETANPGIDVTWVPNASPREFVIKAGTDDNNNGSLDLGEKQYDITVIVVNIQSIDVVSGAEAIDDGKATPDNTDVCAAIKEDGGNILLQMNTDPDIPEAEWPSGLTTWAGGSAVSGHPLQRKISKSAWTKEEVKVMYGTTRCYEMIGYIIGAKPTGTKRDGDSFSDNSGALSTGMHGPTGLAGNYSSGIEIQFTIKPSQLYTDGVAGLFDKADIQWDVSRDKRVRYWKCDPFTGDWSLFDDRGSSWNSDDSWDGEEDNNPWDGNAHLYGNDKPGWVGQGDWLVSKLNMREWVRVGLGGTSGRDGTICSDYQYWRAFRSIRQSSSGWVNDDRYDNELEDDTDFWGAVPSTP